MAISPAGNGLYACVCGWRGVPTIIRGQRKTFCPSCGADEWYAHTLAPVGRNHPCPCGSGRKFKKCHGV